VAGERVARFDLPGAIAVSRVSAYDWPGVDGFSGGTPHLHTTCDEGYLVLAGDGMVQTLSSCGFAQHSLAVGTLLWFTAGTVHRLICGEGGLELVVLMQNAGLPEAGDAILTFPPQLLADPARYLRESRLPPGCDPARSARARRDLAVEGFLRLRAEVEARGTVALEPLYAAANELVLPMLPRWRELWRSHARARSARTGQLLDRLSGRAPQILGEGMVSVVQRPMGSYYGLCGRVTTW
jgi:hypothetical protein